MIALSTEPVKCACVFDLDNLLNNGPSRPYANPKFVELKDKLRRAGMTAGTACRNRPFKPIDQALWEAIGFETVATGCNCDPRVIDALETYANSGCRRLVLGAGDDDYFDVVKRLRKQGIHVEVWARRAKASQRLVSMASKVRWLDSCIIVPDHLTRAGAQFKNDRARTSAMRDDLVAGLERSDLEPVS